MKFIAISRDALLVISSSLHWYVHFWAIIIENAAFVSPINQPVHFLTPNLTEVNDLLSSFIPKQTHCSCGLHLIFHARHCISILGWLFENTVFFWRSSGWFASFFFCAMKNWLSRSILCVNRLVVSVCNGYSVICTWSVWFIPQSCFFVRRVMDRHVSQYLHHSREKRSVCSLICFFFDEAFLYAFFANAV